MGNRFLCGSYFQLNPSMLYAFVRPFATLSFEVYFKKIYLENIDAIPLDKPVFLAVNHPTAFIEPCVLACFVNKPLNFLVRGDLWGKKFYNLLLDGVHLIPIFRKKDGIEKLQNNQDTFKYCYDALAKNKMILIMPEASTKQCKRLRPLSKGLARICLGSIDAYKDLDVYIVPIGANFTKADQPRNRIMVKVGTPIRVMDFYKNYPDNRNKAALKLTQEVKKNLEECVVDVKDEADEKLADQLFNIARTEQRIKNFPIKTQSPIPLKIEQQIAHKINDLAEAEKEAIKLQADNYSSLLKTNNLSDSYQYFNAKWYHWILVILGYIPGLIGKTFHFPIIYLGNFFKSKIRKKEFKQPVFWGAGTVGMLLYYIFWVILGFILKSKFLWLFLFAVPFFGYIHLINSDLWFEIKNKMTFNKLSKTQKLELTKARQPLLEFIEPILRNILN